MRTRWTYWTCSKFADWLRGTAKPRSASCKEWRDWKIEAKKNHPIRFWLADEGLDIIQDIVYYVPDCIHEVKCYLRNRYLDKTHALTSNLKRGQWYEMDTKILNCLFDELVNYVEDDCARMNYEWFEKNKQKETYPHVEAGIAHLDWEISLKYGKGDGIKKGDKDYGKPTHQAIGAKEVKKLYNWWKHVRPARPDPMEISGLSKMYDERRAKYGDDIFGFHEYETKEERKEHSKLSKIDMKLDEKYEEEDTEMLIRLIKIRHKLWN